MNSRIRKRVILLAVMIASVFLVTGCSDGLSPKKLIRESAKNLAGVNSVSNTLDMNIMLENIVDTTKIQMSMEMENTVEPKAGHALGTAKVNMGGVDLESNIEIYQVIEDGAFVTYSGMDGLWVREASNTSDSDAFDSNIFKEADRSVKKFVVSDQLAEYNGRECYQMYGDITGKELLGFVGMDMISAFGLVDLPDRSQIEKLDIPVTIEIYKEEMLPARILIDMSDILDKLYDDNDFRIAVNDFTIILGYQGYDDIPEIVVPDAVKGKL